MNAEQFYNIVPQTQLLDVANRFGTPGYYFFRKILERQVTRIRDCLGSRFELHYAIKANPVPAVLETMVELGCGADVASAGELKAALAAGFPADTIEFSGPGKSLAELEFAIRCEIGVINIENVDELDHIARLAKTLDIKARVGVRINPPVNPKSGLKMAGATQFGLSKADTAIVIQKLIDVPHIEFVGVHIHIGSQVLSAEAVLEGFGAVMELTHWAEEIAGTRVKKVNFGGGWGITYYEGQDDLDLDAIAHGIDKAFESARNRKFGGQYILEPGRFLVGESGVYVTKVLYVKKSMDKVFAIVDGGMHQNYLLAGGMGQVIRRNFFLDVISMGDESTKVAEYAIDIAGCLCTPQDVLARNFKIDKEVRPGDLIVFFNCGAYGLSASPLNFLSHDDPVQVLVE